VDLMEAILTVIITLAAIGAGWVVMEATAAFGRWIGSVDHPPTIQEREARR
jgi:hypothetical protein